METKNPMEQVTKKDPKKVEAGKKAYQARLLKLKEEILSNAATKPSSNVPSSTTKPSTDIYIYSQFHRLFVSRMFALGALMTGMFWYNNSMSCDSNYVRSVCWMNGIYVYPELSRLQGGKYSKLSNHMYGLPDGIDMSCSSRSKRRQCVDLKRRYRTTYIWVPFVLVLFMFIVKVPYYLTRFFQET